MWLIDKIRQKVETTESGEELPFSDTENRNLKEKFLRIPSNVLTPEMIPDFFIPPSLCSTRVLKDSKNQQNCTHKSSALEQKILPSLNTKFETQCIYKKCPIKNFAKLTKSHIIQIHCEENVDPQANSNLGTMEENNDQSCLSLLSLCDMPTYYGAVHLKESAHTRRKESLFHMDIVNVMQVSQEILNKRCPNSSCLHSLQTSLKVQPEINNSRCRPAKDEALAACGNQSEESSSSSPQLLRTRSGFSLFRYFSKDSSSYRVSTRKSKSSLEKNSLSTNQLTSEDGGRCSTIKSCSSCPNLLPLRASPFDYLRCQERLQREHVVKLDKRGIIRLSAEYSLDWATLRVRVITTEEIYEKSFKAKNVNCNVIVCLIPGKVQRQQSAIIKKSKNPIFNEDFFFDGIQKRDLKTLALKMKVINKGTSMKFDTVLGAKSLHLSELLPF